MNGETSPFSAPPDADRIRVFDNYLQSIRHRVNGRIREVVEGNLYDDNLISFLLRGKRLRAAILLLVHDVIAMEPERTEPRALDLACALELAHSASLIVDDIIDEDAERRGLETLHISRGTKMAMLASIGVLSLPYTLIAPYGGEYVSMIADVQRKMIRGVLQEMSPIHACPATAWYEEVITQKTGYLFGLASEWGYMTAAWSDGTLSLVEVTSQKQLREKWRKYGICIGRSMQMADDIVDLRKRLRGETLGNAGSELLHLPS
jgi:geranylgeranyl pyrophosphate synthase